MMLLPLIAVATANKSPLPSFLMILGDDIGWADFKWNNGELCTGFVSPPSNLAKQHVFFPFSLLSLSLTLSFLYVTPSQALPTRREWPSGQRVRGPFLCRTATPEELYARLPEVYVDRI